MQRLQLVLCRLRHLHDAGIDGRRDHLLWLQQRQLRSLQPHAHPVVRGGAVEGAGDRCPPVDHHRVADVVADVPATEVEDLDPGTSVVPVAVDAAEERRRVGVGVEGVEALAAQLAQCVARQLVNAVIGDVAGGLAHAREAGAG